MCRDVNHRDCRPNELATQPLRHSYHCDTDGAVVFQINMPCFHSPSHYSKCYCSAHVAASCCGAFRDSMLDVTYRLCIGCCSMLPLRLSINHTMPMPCFIMQSLWYIGRCFESENLTLPQERWSMEMEYTSTLRPPFSVCRCAARCSALCHGVYRLNRSRGAFALKSELASAADAKLATPGPWYRYRL